jgi:transposase
MSPLAGWLGWPRWGASSARSGPAPGQRQPLGGDRGPCDVACQVLERLTLRGRRGDAGDKLAAHKTDLVEEFLTAHPKVHLNFTPTYSSWLNQVDLWFAKIERDVIARGIFTSTADLKRKLMRYIRHYNKSPRTVKWKYFDPNRRIAPSTSAVTVH